MAKKEKTVELKPRVDKISKAHLTDLQKTVNSINGIQFNIGKIEAQKHTLLHNLSITQDRINVLQDTLMKEYGSVDIDLETGKINWPDENSDSGDSDPKDEK